MLIQEFHIPKLRLEVNLFLLHMS